MGQGQYHDGIFKNMLANKTVAKQLIEHHVAHDVVTRMDLHYLELMPNSFVSKDLRAKSCDVLYRSRIENRECYIYILLEHQSSPYQFMPIRMLNYLSNIWLELIKQEALTKVPYVLPIVIYNGRNSYPYQTSLLEMIDGPKDIVENQFEDIFCLIDLNEISDEQLRSERWSDITLFFMKNIRRRHMMKLVLAMKDMLLIADSQGGKDFLDALFRYIILKSDVDENELTDFFIDNFSSDTQEKIMTAADQIFNRGRREGMQEGMQQGQRMVKNEIIENMRSMHFEPEVIARVTKLPLDEVQKIIA